MSFSDANEATVPDDYDLLLDHYTRHGFRVIALAAKSIPDLTWVKAQRLKREQVESGLRFLGLIIFENKLKPGTAPVMHTLRSAHIGTRMCTGDNIRTAISVGRECGMVSESAKVYMPTFLKGKCATRTARCSAGLTVLFQRFPNGPRLDYLVV